MTDIITTSEAAAILNISRRTVQRMVADGRLTPVRTVPGGKNGHYLFDRAAIEAQVGHGAGPPVGELSSAILKQH